MTSNQGLLFGMTVALAIGFSRPAAGGEIDKILQTAWEQQGVAAAEVIGDEQFLRRVTLDLIGRIPTLSERREFLDAPVREAAIARLLKTPEHARFFAETWTSFLVGYSTAFDTDREVLRLWLERQFRSGVGYDRIAEALVTASGPSAVDGPSNYLVRHPQDQAIQVSRHFLGIRLGCARCHDHPFARWTQDDYQQMQRFFAHTRRQQVAQGNIRLVDSLPDDGESLPTFLSGAQPATSQWRAELALFVTRSRPFARNLANRLWYHLLGRGIVHPPDDFQRQNPPAVPELLEYLTDRLVAERFDLKPVVREICNSQAYQRGSADARPEQQRLFAAGQLKPLTAEQLFDSLTVALDWQRPAAQRKTFIAAGAPRSLDEDFSLTWEYRETVQQLMARLSQTLPERPATAEQHFERILGRLPTDRERSLCRGVASEELIFALIHSNEFTFNH